MHCLRSHWNAHGSGRTDRDRGRMVEQRALSSALLLTFGYLGVEIVGGLITNSLALLSDAALACISAMGTPLMPPSTPFVTIMTGAHTAIAQAGQKYPSVTKHPAPARKVSST